MRPTRAAVVTTPSLPLSYAVIRVAGAHSRARAAAPRAHCTPLDSPLSALSAFRPHTTIESRREGDGHEHAARTRSYLWDRSGRPGAGDPGLRAVLPAGVRGLGFDLRFHRPLCRLSTAEPDCRAGQWSGNVRASHRRQRAAFRGNLCRRVMARLARRAARESAALDRYPAPHP